QMREHDLQRRALGHLLAPKRRLPFQPSAQLPALTVGSGEQAKAAGSRPYLTRRRSRAEETNVPHTGSFVTLAVGARYFPVRSHDRSRSGGGAVPTRPSVGTRTKYRSG